MATVAGVDLADVIVSLANAVADANAVLDEDPRSSYGVTRFEVETTLTAVVSVPTPRQLPPPKLKRAERGTFVVESYSQPVARGLALAELLQPTLREAILPASTNTSAQVRVTATIEPLPRLPTE